MNKISMTVVVPVFNKEDHLKACVESLLSQTADTASFEVVLVDDGSTDSSRLICKKLVERYSFIRLVSQENQGVSAARNTGMKASLGKYIMFLDADDTVSQGTISSLVATFEKYEKDVDLITYPLQYYNPYTNSRNPHKREEWLAEDGVYDLEEYPFIAQSTMNVCVKNESGLDEAFVLGMKMGEDQLFITERLKRKAKIGYCSAAEYIYVKDGSNASKRGNNPLYAFNDMITLYEGLLSIAQEKPTMKEYVYQLILYNVEWRLRGNLLFPTFCARERRNIEERRLAAVLEQVPLASYISSPYLSEYHKGYLLNKYGFSKEHVSVEYGLNGATVQLIENDWQTSKPEIVITHCIESSKKLLLRGHFDCPAFIFDGQPRLFFEFGEEKAEIKLGASSFEYKEAKVKTAKSYGFAIEIPVFSECSFASHRFTAEFPHRLVPAIEVTLALVRHNACVFGNRALFRKCMVEAVGCDLVISRKRKTSIVSLFRQKAQESISFIAKRFLVELFMRWHKKQRVWLYVDLPASPTKGNALVQFLYDIEKNDGVDRYYVSDCGKQLEEMYPSLSGHVIPCETTKHVCFALKAEAVFSSYIEKYTYRPMSQATYDGLGDLVERQALIYLQHGVLHARMPWYISYDRLPFDRIVVSSHFEMDNLMHRYCFPKSAIIPSGMPRLDILPDKIDRSKKKILFAPSWRAYLVAGKASRRAGIDDVLISSSFYYGVRTFVEKLIEDRVLERWGYKLEIKLHPNFVCYEHFFEFDSEIVSLAPERISEGDYAVVITDYSSYVYDFIYAGSDVLYYIPDYKEFKAGLNQYSELEFSLEEDQGFGPFTTDACEATNKLSRLLSQREAYTADQTVYAERRKRFFLHRDGKSSERLYEVVSALTRSEETDPFYQTMGRDIAVEQR